MEIKHQSIKAALGFLFLVILMNYVLNIIGVNEKIPDLRYPKLEQPLYYYRAPGGRVVIEYESRVDIYFNGKRKTFIKR